MKKFLATLRIEGGYRGKMFLCYVLIATAYACQSDLLLSLSLEIESLVRENRKLNWILYYTEERNKMLRKRLRMFEEIGRDYFKDE